MRFTPRLTLWISVFCACPTLALTGTPHPACAPSDQVAAILGQQYEGGGEERAPALAEALSRYL
jgi:hypothetical protein